MILREGVRAYALTPWDDPVILREGVRAYALTPWVYPVGPWIDPYFMRSRAARIGAGMGTDLLAARSTKTWTKWP